MKVLVVGGTGTIGSAVTTELAKLHDVIAIGRISGDYHVDITDRTTITKMCELHSTKVESFQY